MVMLYLCNRMHNLINVRKFAFSDFHNVLSDDLYLKIFSLHSVSINTVYYFIIANYKINVQIRHAEYIKCPVNNYC